MYAERAAALGTRIAGEGLALVYGGGNVGLMGIVADAALAAGGDGFYDPLVAMMDRMVAERFLHAEQRRDLWHGDDIDALFAWMRDYAPASADKWLDEKHRRELR